MARIAALLRRSRREQPQTTEPLQRGRLIAFVGAKGGVGTRRSPPTSGWRWHGQAPRRSWSTCAEPGTVAAMLGIAPAAALTGCRWPGRS